MLFDASTSSLKNISDGLNFVTQTWRWLMNAMIQTSFIYGTGFKKPDYYKNHFRLTKEKPELLETILDVTI